MRRWLFGWVLLSVLVCVWACSAPIEKTPGPLVGEFDAMTYNVHGLPSGITGDDTVARLTAIGPLINGYGIVGLQEVFIDEGHDKLIASNKHKTQLRFADRLEGKAMGPGLLFLSEYEVLDKKVRHYDQCNGTLDGASDCLASKGFQMTRLKLGEGVELDVYNSHLEAGSGEKDLAVRARHVEMLGLAMKEWSLGRAILFLGDTNLKETRASDLSALTKWLKEAGLKDGCEEAGCAMKGRIDRVLFRGSKQLTLTAKKWSIPEGFVDGKGTALSDHEPIVVKFSWKFE